MCTYDGKHRRIQKDPFSPDAERNDGDLERTVEEKRKKEKKINLREMSQAENWS